MKNRNWFIPHLKNEVRKNAGGSRSLSAGFTLIEVLISIGIVTGLILVISMFGFDIFSFQLFLGDTFSSQQEIGITMTEMGVQARAMGPSANGSYPIEYASATVLVFYSDIDGDEVFERVRYFVSGSDLVKGIIEPSGNPAVYSIDDEVTKKVVSSIILPPVATDQLFTYYGPGYTGIESPLSEPIDIDQVRLVNVTITVDKTPENLLNRLDYSTTMMIRNLRDSQ